MYGDCNSIDMDQLKDDMENDALGAFFGGGFGGAFVDALDIRDASDDELIEMAEERGVDLSRYRR